MLLNATDWGSQAGDKARDFVASAHAFTARPFAYPDCSKNGLSALGAEERTGFAE
jgi:hypothetical protein